METMQFTPLNPDTKLKEYYMAKYSTDELGQSIKDNLTFTDLFECLDNYQCVYEFINVHDSVVRERLFQALSIVMKCDYDYIYQQWAKHYTNN